MTRSIMRQYLISIVKRSGQTTRFNLEKGPSDKWFRKFISRHAELTERTPEAQDRSRGRMSNPKVMQQYFGLLQDTIDKLGVQPNQIFNCDETGWSGKEKSRQKVIAVKGHHSYQQSVISSGHLTAHICICGDGRVLPTFIIFEKSLPHTAYKDGVPSNWLFGYSDNSSEKSDRIPWYTGTRAMPPTGTTSEGRITCHPTISYKRFGSLHLQSH